MTTRENARQEGRLRFGAGERGDPGDPGPGLPDRLAAARERKGVDLIRAERDTKIRVRYLSALESGDYRDLPGAVYTKGFLRNYAIYLGLDPEDVLRQWRRERGEATAPEAVIVPPRPLAEPSRPLNFSPQVVVAALLTVGVVLFFIYLGAQLLRYSRPPELAVTSPATAVFTVEDETTTFRLAGTTSPGSIIEIITPGREQPFRVTPLANGDWFQQVDLRHGQNRFDIKAVNPETKKESEDTRQVVITVPFPEILAPTLTVSQPVEGDDLQQRRDRRRGHGHERDDRHADDGVHGRGGHRRDAEAGFERRRPGRTRRSKLRTTGRSSSPRSSSPPAAGRSA